MRAIQILDRQYNVLAFMSNDTENGLHYTKDKLKTSIEGGIYTLDFEAPKTSSDIQFLKEGHYITFINDQDVRLLMEIKNITEDRLQKTIHCQDVNINLINPYADPSLAPNAPQTIDYYINHAIAKTGWEIGKQEFTETMILEYTNDQSILERIRDICSQYGAEFYFSVGEFESGKSPNFYINIVKKRLEGEEGFRISSDDYVQGIQRRVNNDGVITKMRVRGKAIEPEVDEDETNEVVPSVPDITDPRHEFVEKAIARGFELQKLRLPYVWGGNSASRGMDCSGSMQEIFRHAGVTPSHRWTTYSMWGNTGGQFKRISKSELKRGDCIMYDTKYTTSRPNHVGVYLGDNQVMHSGNPNFIVQRADSMEIVGYVRVLMPSEY